jgi:hypothetical protein
MDAERRQPQARAPTRPAAVPRKLWRPKRGRPRKLQEKDAKYLDEEIQGRAAYAEQSKSLEAMNGFAGGAPVAANATVAQGNIGKGSVSSMQSHQGSRVLSFEDDLVAAMGDEIVSTDNKTGETRWKRKIDGDMARLGGALVTAPAAAGGAIFLGTTAGEIWRLDPKSGEVAQRWTVGGPVRSQPVIEGGWIYVGTEKAAWSASIRRTRSSPGGRPGAATRRGPVCTRRKNEPVAADPVI